MRGRVLHALKPLDAQAIENALFAGVPDVEFIGGWIELKALTDWPKRPDTLVRIEHFTMEQRHWLRRRVRRGGKAWLLLRVGKEWLLFPGDKAADIIGTLTRAQLVEAALFYWPATPTDMDLLMAFRKLRSETTA